MCLDREVHTARDVLDPVQQGIASYLQTLETNNNGQGNDRVTKTSTKTTFTTRSATEQRTLVQKEGDQDSKDQDTGEARNNLQEQ